MRKPQLALLLGAATTLVAALMPSFAFAAYSPRMGDVIRGQAYSAVYWIGPDLKRYVFPNEKTYFTWFGDFNNVVWLQDSELANINIGGNVTYRPAVKMIKIQSDPRAYMVSCGKLRWVKNESVASGLFGPNWNRMIDDVPDAFFVNYSGIGDEIRSVSDYDREYELSHCSLPGNVR